MTISVIEYSGNKKFAKIMADVHEPKVRSYNMSQIRSKNTKPELLVRKFLHSQGLRFRLHNKNLPGKPDIVLKRFKTIIFIHGCFWHGHEGCKYFVVPKSRTEWWLNKINRNKENDKTATLKLKKEKWRVIEVWECELKSYKRETILKRILAKLKNL